MLIENSLIMVEFGYDLVVHDKDWMLLIVSQPWIKFKFAMSTAHLPAAGGEHLYTAASDGMVCSDGSSDICVYDYPLTAFKPRYAHHYPRIQVDSSCPPSVKVCPILLLSCFLWKKGGELVTMLKNNRCSLS